MTPTELAFFQEFDKKLNRIEEFERAQIALLGEVVKCMESWRQHDQANDRLGERLDAHERRLGLTRPGPHLHLVRPE